MKKLINSALIICGILFSVSAYSATPGWYAGIGFTNTSFDHDVSGWNDGSLTSGSVDDSDTGLTVYFGNRLSNNLAVEFGHVDLGEASFKGTSTGGFIWNPGSVAGSVDVSGIQIAGLAIAPISDNMEFYAKAGLFMWEADLSLTNTVFGSGSGSEDDNDLFFGVGFQYNFNNNSSLRVAWEDYGDFDLEIDTSAIMVGLNFNL